MTNDNGAVALPGPSFDELVSTPPDDAVLWRYLPVIQFARMLQSESLWFSRLEHLGDPFEGSVSRVSTLMREALVEHLAGGDEAKAEGLRTQMSRTRELRRAVFVSCWHQSEYESDAMWRLYMRDAGVAIRTDVGTPRSQLTRPAATTAAGGDIFVGTVSYLDYTVNLVPTWNVIGPALYKRAAFSHESEVRALFMSFREFTDGSPSPDGFDIPIEPSALIGLVRVNPMADSWVLESVQNLASTYGLQAPVEQSDLQSDPLW
jgi:hypothetical protein